MAWSVSPQPAYLRAHIAHLLRCSAALLYFCLMLYIVLGMLNEFRPVWYYILAAVLFVLSQLDYFLLNKVICNVRLFISLSPLFRETYIRDGHAGRNTAQTGRLLRGDGIRNSCRRRVALGVEEYHRRRVSASPSDHFSACS